MPPLRYVLSSLQARLVLLLTIALLPIGAVAVYQTAELIGETRRLEERDVLSRTVRAASGLEAVLERAYGAAEALGAAASLQNPSSEACSAVMQQFTNASLDYVFAGFIEIDGTMRCTSSGTTIEYAGTEDWEDFLENPRRMVRVNPLGDASRQPVLIAFSPIRDPADGALLGGQAVSMPQWLTEALLDAGIEDVEVALLAPDGEILAASTGMDNPGPFDALTIRPERLDIPEAGRLVPAASGERDRPVALVPLIRNQIYVAGLWNRESRPEAVSILDGSVTPAFPVVMWIASLAVAFLAVNGLLLRHLRRLSRQMTRFRVDDDDGHFATPPDAPAEIRSIGASYNAMVDRIATDRRTLQENLREKEILLREVHHRVKNNLQLIASILNMQIRGVTAPDARRILLRVQDRVMSLSTIHKALYSSEQVDRVEADKLLREVVSGVLNVALPAAARAEIGIRMDAVTLDPDQTVPLSLLATEAVTNAAKHLGKLPDGPPRITITLSCEGDGQVGFEVCNTRGTPINPDEADQGTHLGRQLIAAFASQLEGDLTVRETESEYRMSVKFRRIEPGLHGG